jgi:hypothetical protein
VLILKVIALLILMIIFAQDVKSKSVYWILFPALSATFIGMHTLQNGWGTDWIKPALINIAFIALQLLVISIYFSVKSRNWVFITSGMIGWGDILFLLSIAFYLSTLSFLFFYITSLLAILIIYLAWTLFSKQTGKQIPLAGLQALLFAVFLSADWWLLQLNLSSDDWALNILEKWI